MVKALGSVGTENGIQEPPHLRRWHLLNLLMISGIIEMMGIIYKVLFHLQRCWNGKKQGISGILPSSAKPSHAAAGDSQISWAEISFIITAQPPTHPSTHPPTRPPTHPPGDSSFKAVNSPNSENFDNNNSHTNQIK